MPSSCSWPGPDRPAPALTGDEDELALVEEISRRLDGLPLAIELAAARTRAFSVEHVASRLHDRFRLLTGGSRTALPRQQTLEAVVDWSYDLLFEDEQRLFERLSVFPGGCDLATATIVCSADDLPAEDVEDLVAALVEKSLVASSAAPGHGRITLLQTLAQYGREKLSQRGDAVRIRDAMAAHFARLCAASTDAFTGPEQRSWLIAVDRERENLRAALDWAVDRGDAETATTIASGTSWAHWLGGTVLEGRQWLDLAASADGEVGERTEALARTGRGLLSFQSGLREGVDEHLEAALATFTRLGDVRARMLAHSVWAEVAATRGEIEEGRRRRRLSVAFYESLPDEPFSPVGRAYALAKLAQLDGDEVAAERWYREAVEHLTVIDRPVVRAMCLGMVAEFDERAQRYDPAVEHLEEAIEISASLGLRGFLGSLLARLGWVLLLRGDIARAEEAYRRALDAGRPLGNTLVVSLATDGLAAVHRLTGDDAAAATSRDGGAPAPHAHRARADVQPEQRSRRAGHRRSGQPHRPGGDHRRRRRPGAAADHLRHADELRAAAGAPVPAFQQHEVDRLRSLTA